jgi:two-component system, chemotaxis family, protein-glutamate methylesterase/glutaminase
MIRVVVVEDSTTARTLLVSLLQNDPEIQVVGEAADGVEGVALTQKLRPDVVTMDIHMPRMDGLAATKEVMITVPTPIVIVTGSSVAADVGLALNTLRAGAVALLHKPNGPGTPGFEEAARKLCDTVKAMASVKVVRHWRRSPAPEVSRVVPRRRMPDRVIAIVASTGGPEALQRLLSELPGDFPTPVLVVQHITPGFTQGLADWLNSTCDLHVKVAEPGELLRPHFVYLAPDDRHLGVTKRDTVAVSDSAPVGGFRPAGTYLFDSVAAIYSSSVTAVILTGMGQDGVEGLRSIRRAGGRIFAQDEKSSVVWGMPGAAAAAGLPDLILPLEEIVARLFVGP